MTTPKSLILILGILVFTISIYIAYKWLTYPNLKTYKDQIRERYSYDMSSMPDRYEQDCNGENDKRIKFPLDEPAYARLHYDKFWKKDKMLTNHQTNEFLELLNDTSTYTWGEIGTPYFDRFVTFHDKTGWCIGLTEVSYDGQTYSTPNISKMKWGLLKGSHLNKIIAVLENKEYQSK